jgi:hypothetical protein
MELTIMTFQLNRSSPRQRITLQPAVPELAGLGGATKLEIHALEGAIVVNKAEMSAIDMVRLIKSISTLVTELSAHLGLGCGQCDGCGYCDNFCGDDAVRLPTYVLEAAGLSPDCKLEAFVDEDGNITVGEADYAYDLTDVPPDLLEAFRSAWVCLHELEERLIQDCIVYGLYKKMEEENSCAKS